MKSFFKVALAALAIGASCALPVAAQEKPATILVLDASGSMWGQIDGVNKITIARDVVADILADFPDDQNLGFVTYGHRQRGQCSDIQTIIDPAPGTAAEIVKIVNELNPRGMTPMTDAVIAAAQALRSTEQPATVILVSDGIETCNPDPCAAARELEKAGMDFTAHVIGFDVRGEAEALMQMQCIADETGGRFLTADNAAELSEALREVVAAPSTGTFTFTAYQNPVRMGPEPVFFAPESTVAEPLLTGAVSWEISDNEYSFVRKGGGNPFTVDLPFGEYVVTVTADAWDQPVQSEELFAPDSIRNLAVMFPAAAPPLAELTLRAVMDSDNGTLIETPITWSLAMDGETFELDGNPAQIELREGSWSVTAFHVAGEVGQSNTFSFAAGAQRTETFIFETPLPQVELIAPDSAPAATTLTVGYRGDGLHEQNRIGVYNAETGKRFSEGMNRGNDEVRLLLPPTPGAYELRYYLGHDIAARKPLQVTPVDIRIIAPDSAPAASHVEVSWTGLPEAENDLVRVREVGQMGAFNEARTRSGTSVILRMPATPGRYELTYEQRLSEPVVIRPIEVTPVDIHLIAPATVPAGAEFEVSWAGLPVANHDLVRLRSLDGGRGRSESYTRNRDSVRLRAPDEPGAYEIIYLQGNLSNIVARLAVSVTQAE